MIRARGRVVVGALVVMTAALAVVGVCMAAASPTADDLIQETTDQLDVLLTDLRDRMESVEQPAIAELTQGGSFEVTLAKRLRAFSVIAANIEKDSTKSAGQMKRLIDRTTARLERMHADQADIDRSMGLYIYYEDAAFLTPYRTNKRIFEGLAEFLGVIP